MMTRPMLRRFAACCAAVAVVAGGVVADHGAGQPEAARQAARSNGMVMAAIMREARNGNLVVSREVDGRIVIDAVAPTGEPVSPALRVAALR